jgi:hypothetical protein
MYRYHSLIDRKVLLKNHLDSKKGIPKEQVHKH